MLFHDMMQSKIALHNYKKKNANIITFHTTTPGITKWISSSLAVYTNYTIINCNLDTCKENLERVERKKGAALTPTENPEKLDYFLGLFELHGI